MKSWVFPKVRGPFWGSVFRVEDSGGCRGCMGILWRHKYINISIYIYIYIYVIYIYVYYYIYIYICIYIYIYTYIGAPAFISYLCLLRHL